MADYFLFDRLTEGLGDKRSLLFGKYEYTYRDVAERSQSFAAALCGAGVGREGRVYIVLEDVPAFAWSLFGTLKAGAVVCMGNPHAPVDSLEYNVEYTRCQALVTTPKVAASLTPVLKDLPELKCVYLVAESATGEDCERKSDIPPALEKSKLRYEWLCDAVANPKTSQLPAVSSDDVAMWLFTSGSTGHSKAAVHTHRDFVFNTERYAKGTVGYKETDVTVSVPRLFFGYATGTNLFFPFAVGATVGLFSERPTAQSLAKAIEDYRPSIVTNVPTMMSKLLDHHEQAQGAGKGGLDFENVRFCLSAGEALPPALLSRFQSTFECEVFDGIGSAEMFHIYITNRPGDVKPGSLGRIVDGYEGKILPADATGAGVAELSIGEVGVLWVRGDSVALYYHQDREKSWRTFHGHWCRTGDLFRKDADGYYWFSGRADDLFKASGIWVAPGEVEDCLMGHEGVALAAVIPFEDEGLLKPKAFVVLRPGVAPSDELVVALQNRVKETLSKHTYPRWVEFVSDLPRNDRGKVDRKALKEKRS